MQGSSKEALWFLNSFSLVHISNAHLLSYTLPSPTIDNLSIQSSTSQYATPARTTMPTDVRRPPGPWYLSPRLQLDFFLDQQLNLFRSISFQRGLPRGQPIAR